MKVLLAANGPGAPDASIDGLRPDVEVVPIDMYGLDATSLVHYRALLIGMHSDQYELQRVQSKLERYLSCGGIIVYCGHVAHPFLYMLATFRPIPRCTLEDLKVALDTTHPIYRGVEAEDVTFRRGVAGFFGRGSNPPPAGARVVATLAKGTMPLDWEIPVGAGWLYVHAGLDLWRYAGAGDGTARRIPLQLLEWVEAVSVGQV